MRREWILGVTLAVCAAGCGGGSDEAARQQAEAAAQTAEEGAAAAAAGLEDMAKSIGAMAEGAGAGGKVEPVSFRDLIALLPEVDGWERSEPTGERMTSPFAFATAEASYTRGDASVEVTITDSGFNQMLLAPYAMFLASGYERESTDGYEKSTTVNGHPGWEKWTTSSKDGELNALAGKRFLVQIEGRGLDDIKALHEFAGRLDLSRLAALK